MALLGTKHLSGGTAAWRRYLAAIGAAVLLAGPVAASAAQLTDMAGRRVTVPDTITTVWSAYPPLTYLIYALDPSLLVGWNFPLGTESRAFVPERYRHLPVVGGWFGQRTPNIEALATARPDVALVWDESLRSLPGMERQLQSLAIPVVAIRLERLDDYPATIRFLGMLLNRRARAEKLAAAVAGTVAGMRRFAASIPPEARRSVYYAIGPDGLNNDCNHLPFLEEAIGLAGGRSAQRCRERGELGNRVSLETVMGYDPDVIITQDDTFFRTVKSDRRWRTLRAVRQNRVYRIPARPFNWLNYPPSFMRVIGIRWLAGVIYPERCRDDLRQEVQRFFRLFLNVRLANGEVGTIISPSGEKRSTP